MQRFQIGWVLMTEPVTAKREQVSKKDDKEDNASVQEIMVRSNNMGFPSPFWTFGDYITTRRWSIFDVAGRRRRICETQGSPHEEGVLYALGFKVGTSLKVLESRDFSSSSSNILPQVLRQHDHLVSGWLLQSIWPEFHLRRPLPIACRGG